ncbi:MAG: LacI family DNA-binding transcriptional regulator [Cyclobacteriaceae bacterium]|nr:LacI family DNA-binding transcriptional regulator [Cyclobacteriaceae bacterium]
MIQKSIRIRDIALKAGVSEGTVDRVIHNRGKVSATAAKKVQQVLAKLNYKPNLIARTLGKNKTYRIAALIPDHTYDDYWRQSYDGIKLGEMQLAQFGIHFSVEPYFFNMHRKESYLESSLKLFHSKPDGVLVAPLFFYASKPFFKKLSEKHIPFILINTQLQEVGALSFIGQDLFQSGRLAAELISYGLTASRTFAILHIEEDLENSVHLQEKERGFKEYLNQYNKPQKHDVKSFVLDAPKSNSFISQLKEVIALQNLAGVFISTSKGYSVASFIKQSVPYIRIIGYDLIKENLACLQNGTLDFLINQNPMRQAKLGIQTLANHLIFKKDPPPLHLFPLEIITPQNVSTYLSHEGNQSGISI